MGLYDLSKTERIDVIHEIYVVLESDIKRNEVGNILVYFEAEDTYTRKAAYENVGKIYARNITLRTLTIRMLNKVSMHESDRIRQTAVNAAGEIGKMHFEQVMTIFDRALFDEHHAVRNAVIGSLKKMVNVNPKPTLKWAEQYLPHPDKEVRREICHGIELRGRTHPEDVLPLLEVLQFDETRRVRDTLIHVIGQISYKKGCLEKVLPVLERWENQELVKEALAEIIDVHGRYSDFAFYNTITAINKIRQYFEI